ncbi:hypothetical protein D3C72_2108320 [compost metagenome]
MLAALVFGQIAHAFQFRELVQHLLFDPFFQGHVDHGTAVTAAAELQDRQTVFGDLHQRDFTAVARQLRVDLGLQQILYALHQRRIIRHFTHFGVWCFQRQLRTQLIGDEIDLGVIKVWRA